VGSRVIDCEGSGHISVRSPAGSVIRCEIGYVTGGLNPGSSHRFKIKDRACLRLSSIPVRLSSDANLSIEAAKKCGIRNVRRHVGADGELELGYFKDEQSPSASECIEQWSESQLSS
jgi:hypothetical protein